MNFIIWITEPTLLKKRIKEQNNRIKTLILHSGQKNHIFRWKDVKTT